MAVTGERPPARWSHATTLLRDFAIISWAVEPSRVRALLPAGFEPIADHGTAQVSMVPFIDRLFRFRCLGFAPVTCGQVNYRTYVRRGRETGVWFFGTTLDSGFVALPKRLWKMPWHRASVDIRADWDGSHCDTWELAVRGRWDTASVQLRGLGQPCTTVTGYTEKQSQAYFFDPLMGWYLRTGTETDDVARYSVWHEPLRLEKAEVVTAHSRALTRLRLLDAGQPPAWAAIQRAIHFDVHTPPVRC